MQDFVHIFPEFATSDPEMEKNIGRKVRFLNGGQMRTDGAVHRELFEIIGVQRDYRGELCYRVKCLAYEDRFGCVMPVNRVVWADNE